MNIHGDYVSKCIVCVRGFFPFILDVRVVGVPAGVTQEEGHTGFLIHLPSAVLALIFLARRIQPFLSFVDREVEFLCAKDFNRSPPVGLFFGGGGGSEEKFQLTGFEITSQRVTRFRGHQLNHWGDRLYNER